MSLEPDSTPSRVPPPLVSSTSPYPPPRSSFSQRRHEAFSDNMFRSATDLQVSSAESSGSQAKSLCDGRLASLKAEEAANRRFQATAWIKSMVGSLDIPCEPSEEEFRLFLRNGIILCNLINKVQPGAVSKVVANHVSSLPPEGRPLYAYQYFENVRNFLVAAEDMKFPTFEASHLEQESLQPGSTTKIVDCILAMKSYYEWKQCGGNGSWKYAGPLRSPMIPRSTGNFLQRSTPSVPVRDIETLPDLSIINIDDGEKRLDDIFQSKDIMGAWLKRFAVEMTNDKENVDQNLVEAIQTAATGSMQAFMNLIIAIFAENNQDKFSLKRQDQDNQLLLDSADQKNGHCSPFQSQDPKPLHISQEHQMRLEAQRKEVKDIRDLLLKAREDVQGFQAEWLKHFELLDNQIAGISNAASGYHRVLEENKILYNNLQDLKGSIRVYCRIRPHFGGQSEAQSAVEFIGEDGSLLVNTSKMGKDVQRIFNFNKVFGPSATQEEIYIDTQPLIRSVMDGYNVCIFAYGQTGSGKTHTMSGPTGASEKEMGVNYRALSDLFELSQKRKDLMVYEVSVQMIEIYNEQVRDLLGALTSSKKLDIRNNGHKGFNVPDAILMPVKATSDVLDLMNFGQKNRTVSYTALNDRSSRSHSVLTVHVQGTDRVSGCNLHSCLNLVDLAGSERVDKSEVTGDRLKEAQYINKSLSSLGDVIAALAQRNSHVPYRNSKLTQLLQDSLGGKAKTLMFVHISPEPDSYGETISTLKFAERVSSVELGAARLNKESGEVRELREQVECLKKALAKKEAEVAQLQNMRESPVIDKHKLQTPVRSRRLSLEAPGISKVEVQNGIYSFGMGTQDDKFVDSGEKAKLNETPIGKQTGNRRSSLGYDRRNLSGIKSGGTDGETNTGTETTAPSASKKTSQIKKSLHSFGKLINGEKRSTVQVESSPPVCSGERRLSSGGQNQLFSNRQPLTVVNNSGSGRPRRNSVEGKAPVESKTTASPNGHGERTCKTPPDQQAMKAGKRRM